MSLGIICKLQFEVKCNYELIFETFETPHPALYNKVAYMKAVEGGINSISHETSSYLSAADKTKVYIKTETLAFD